MSHEYNVTVQFWDGEKLVDISERLRLEIIADIRNTDEEGYELFDSAGEYRNLAEWTEMEETGKRVSKMYPGYVIVVYEDTNYGDLNVYYFRDGRMQAGAGEQKVAYDEFDPRKMK